MRYSTSYRVGDLEITATAPATRAIELSAQRAALAFACDQLGRIVTLDEVVHVEPSDAADLETRLRHSATAWGRMRDSRDDWHRVADQRAAEITRLADELEAARKIGLDLVDQVAGINADAAELIDMCHRVGLTTDGDVATMRAAMVASTAAAATIRASLAPTAASPEPAP